ncbi:hypothetical protein IWX47DRAFT_475295 [Phyllosticta citricarpa]
MRRPGQADNQDRESSTKKEVSDGGGGSAGSVLQECTRSRLHVDEVPPPAAALPLTKVLTCRTPLSLSLSLSLTLSPFSLLLSASPLSLLLLLLLQSQSNRLLNRGAVRHPLRLATQPTSLIPLPPPIYPVALSAAHQYACRQQCQRTPPHHRLQRFHAVLQRNIASLRRILFEPAPLWHFRLLHCLLFRRQRPVPAWSGRQRQGAFRFEPFVSIFANHVLLDAILLTIPRVAFLAFLSTLPTSICSASDFPNFFLPPTSPTLPGADTARIHAYAGSYGGAATSQGHFWSEDRDQCFVVVNTLMGVAACLAVMTGVAQWCVALRVRKFAQALRRQSLVEQPVEGDQVVFVAVDEKRGLEKV